MKNQLNELVNKMSKSCLLTLAKLPDSCTNDRKLGKGKGHTLVHISHPDERPTLGKSRRDTPLSNCIHFAFWLRQTLPTN
jgi:hypothetical protein